MSERFDAVVFDLDGTLIDSEPDLRAALNLTLAAYGRSEVTRPQVIQMIGDGVPKLVERGFDATRNAPHDLPDAPLETAIETFLGFYEGKAAALSTPFPGAVDALRNLRQQGLQLGVCTNKPQRPTLEILDVFGITGDFGAVVGGDTLDGIRKPDGRHLAAVLDQLEIAPARAVMVGDNHNDAGTAQSLGVPFVAVSFGYARGPVSELGADAVIDHFGDLAAALDALGTP
ncbi:MAG: phosphoglycolate phosphatase [Rhodospirillaceae bacterium]|nr:phosphoglycolate phosphatase [Rhodospirillaceae bacterium]